VNRWKCDHPDCTRECVGTGGAVGLRAIGWWFVYAGPIYCPAHRPDPIHCAADQEAERWQKLIMAEVGGFPETVGGTV